MAELIIDILLLGAFIAILVKSAIFAINSIVKFSKITGIGELAVGFVIVAISTSTPEISVAIFATQSDNVGITLGDIFGSNVTNIALIAALFLFISPIRKVETKTLKSLLPFLLMSSAIPLILLITQEGSTFVAGVLLAVFGFFLFYTFKFHLSVDHDKKENGSALKSLIYFFIGIGLVIISAKIIVDSASSIADATGVRESVIGATIIAFGTSLPELTVDIIAVRKRHLELALGDIIGSCITNITLVLGIVLVLSAVTVNFGILSTLISFSIIAPFVLFVFLRIARIQRWNSFVLFGIYAAFLIFIYGIQISIGGIRIF